MNELQSSPRLKQRAIAALMPFFLDGASNDRKAAHLVINELLDDYQPATAKELQLAAQIIALTWAAVTCLRAGVGATNLSMREVLDLQNSAVALERSSQRTARDLVARQQGRAMHAHAMIPQVTEWDEGVFQLVINQALDKMNDARARLAASSASLVLALDPKVAFLAAEKMARSVLARRTTAESAAADQNADREY